MAYDGFYSGLSDRATVSELLNQAIAERKQLEIIRDQTVEVYNQTVVIRDSMDSKLVGYLRDAPMDSKTYGRNNGQWVEAGGTPVIHSQLNFSPSNSRMLVARQDNGAPLITRLSTQGSQFVNGRGEKVRLRSCNWFGGESDNFTPHGTWQRPYKAILADIKSMGFNCIRLALSGAFRDTNLAVKPTAVDWGQNPELVGLTAHQVIKAICDYAAELNMYIVLDYHRVQPGGGADGSPIQPGFQDIPGWLEWWGVQCDMFRDCPNVIGADIYNEPHLHTWEEWATMAESCGDYIHRICPDWIIFVEGVGSFEGESYWWGGQLKGVRSRPVELAVANKLAYAPHEYGQSVGQQTWLSYDGAPVPGYPGNLPAVFNSHWGYIAKEGIAPIWIGEFGGHFGVDGTGQPTKPHGVYEKQWAAELANYCNAMGPGNQGISFAYWAYNPISADTGGLVQDDWVTHQQVKLDVIQPLME